MINDLPKQVSQIRAKRQRPRRYLLSWMKRNPFWYREAIAIEWEKQTGEDWLLVMKDATAA